MLNSVVFSLSNTSLQTQALSISSYINEQKETSMTTHDTNSLQAFDISLHPIPPTVAIGANLEAPLHSTLLEIHLEISLSSFEVNVSFWSVQNELCVLQNSNLDLKFLLSHVVIKEKT